MRIMRISWSLPHLMVSSRLRRLWAAAAFIAFPASAQDAPPPIQREMRAIWIATVDNLDWPSRAGLSTAQQQHELIAMLDRAAALRMNAIILQVRPAADAL